MGFSNRKIANQALPASETTGSMATSTFVDRRPQAAVQRRQQQLMQAAKSSTSVQRVVYKEKDYQKDKPGFLESAISDLGLDKSAVPLEVSDSLDQLKDHDATTVIKDEAHLSDLIKLDQSEPEEQFAGEFSEVQKNCSAMNTPATTLSTFAEGAKSGPQSELTTLNGLTDNLDRIPVQERGFTGVKGLLEALGSSLGSAKTIIPKADKVVTTIKKTGESVKKWAVAFPELFWNSMRKWRIKGTIGAEDSDSSNYLTIGPKSDTLGPEWSDKDKRGAVIRAEPWSPGINDTWLKSGIKTALPFKLSRTPPETVLEALRTGSQEQLRKASIEHAEENRSTPAESHYWDTRSNSFTRLGVELSELLNSGYRLSE